MPGDRHLAGVRLNCLKRKFAQDQRYKHDYSEKMSDIIKRGDAEDVQEEEIYHIIYCTYLIYGMYRYIPHYGISMHGVNN